MLAAALGVGLIGVLMELTLLRRIYRVPELFQLLATFGVVLAVQDLVLKVWGPLDILGPRAPGLRQAVVIFGHRFPAYELFLIVMGPLVLGLLWLLMHKTRYGVLVRAATQDREMVGALGVNQALLFTGTLFLGAALAGLGGALQTPEARRQPAHGHLGHRRDLRGHRGRRHGLGARRVPRRAADRPAAGLRHPGVSRRSRWCWCSC